jgi:hypothetical protein
MSAQILKLTLLPGVDRAVFEQTLKKTILPKVDILLRTVKATSHRFFRTDTGGADSSTYVWLTFTQLVGSTPEIAGEGPIVLCETPLPLAAIAKDLATLATARSSPETSRLLAGCR